MEYVILARVTAPIAKGRLVELLQAAFDGGAAGMFETQERAPGQFDVAFLRDSVEDEEFIVERLPQTPIAPVEETREATIVQLVEELEEADVEASESAQLDEIIEQVRETAWLPFVPNFRTFTPVAGGEG